MRNLKEYPITDDEAIQWMEIMKSMYIADHPAGPYESIGDPVFAIMDHIIEQLSIYKDLKES